MSDPEKKKKKSRPKSEVVKSGEVNEKRHKSSSHKTDADAPTTDREKTKSRSRRDKTKEVKSDPEADELKHQLDAAKAQKEELTQQVAALQKDNEELAQKYVGHHE
jgi:hypothetical protein